LDSQRLLKKRRILHKTYFTDYFCQQTGAKGLLPGLPPPQNPHKGPALPPDGGCVNNIKIYRIEKKGDNAYR
jgi:hypothetical protein